MGSAPGVCGMGSARVLDLRGVGRVGMFTMGGSRDLLTAGTGVFVL